MAQVYPLLLLNLQTQLQGPAVKLVQHAKSLTGHTRQSLTKIHKRESNIVFEGILGSKNLTWIFHKKQECKSN